MKSIQMIAVLVFAATAMVNAPAFAMNQHRVKAGIVQAENVPENCYNSNIQVPTVSGRLEWQKLLMCDNGY